VHLVLAKDVEDIIANNNATMVTLSIMVTLPVYFLRRSKGQNQPFKKLRAYRCTGVHLLYPHAPNAVNRETISQTAPIVRQRAKFAAKKSINA
jgi:hypothetical protein